MKREYAIYDVFTDTPLSGNPLGIVFDSKGLNGEQMQAIALEFNLSETAFLAPPADDAHTAAIRIFTPKDEIPFAGHPTVGTAVAIAEQRFGGDGTPDMALFVIEEKIGPVRAAVRRLDGKLFAEFDLPRLPEQLPFEADKALIAAGLGLEARDIGFENHVASFWTAGNAFVMVPVHGLEACAKATVHIDRWCGMFAGTERVPAPFIYCRDTVNHDSSFHARMLAPHLGIPEDPATGSAVAAFAGAIAQFDEPVDGPGRYFIEQGLEMGRPSRIRLEMDIAGGTIQAARIGGHAVRVSAGHLFV